MALDERLRRELERAARPADPSGVYEHLIRRRERRRMIRRMQAGGLALAVFGATIAGFYVLMRTLPGTEPNRPATPPAMSNGLLVFSIPLEGGGEALMAVAPDGTGLRRLSPEGRANYRSPDVSPDGRSVVVVHEIATFERQSVLATVPIAGGSPTWLSEQPGYVSDPAWSPEGDRIAFVGSVPPGGVFGIYVFELATGEARLIPGTDNMLTRNLTWSPDGETVAFAGAIPDPGDPNRFPWDIYSVRLDGSRFTNLTRTPDDGEVWPAWSWASDRIAFIRGREASGLYTMAADGSGEVLVFDGLPDLANPAWSPDGAFLAFSAATGQVYVIPAGGGDPVAVTGAFGDVAWQALPEGPATSPIPSATPSPSPSPEQQEIGLGFPVCNVVGLRHVDLLGDGADGTAWTYAKLADDGGCPDRSYGRFFLATDNTGDGLADESWGPFENCGYCEPFGALDLNADGAQELAVLAQDSSTPDYMLFAVRPDAEGVLVLRPIVVAPPGHEPAGLLPGEPFHLWTGGDEGFTGDAACEGYPDDPILVVSWSDHPIEGPGSETREVHITRLVLDADGALHVADTNDFTMPTGEPLPYPFDSYGAACGLDFFDVDP